MTTPAISPSIMERLAFIRLLHQQGIDQSRLPEPLNFTCILTFHDAVELFLMLTSEYLGIQVEDKKPFVTRYYEGLHPSKAVTGVELAGRNGVKRLTDLRNAFKHVNAWPGSRGIEDSRADATTFFEENTQKVFGLTYANIDMADLVTQDEVRQMIKDAVAADEADDRLMAMGLLNLAFKRLFNEHVVPSHQGASSMFSFGRNLKRPMSEGGIKSVLTQHECHSHHNMHSRPTPKAKIPPHPIEALARQITDMSDATLKMQEGLRVIAIGVEYHRYLRFDQLTPGMPYQGEDGELAFSHHPADAATDEEFGYCHQFVITVALRLAEIEAHMVRPSWYAR